MKKINSLLILSALLLVFTAGCTGIKSVDATADDPRMTFRDLDSYGQWINNSSFGNVWRPDVDFDWRPYYEGQWQLTDRGWMWTTNEPFGWIVYHYGYWAYTSNDGWLWIPGYEWTPTKVVWLSQDDYICWAPLPPKNWNLPSLYDHYGDKIWTVVRARDFNQQNIFSYHVPFNTIRTEGNWISRIPDPNFIQNSSGREITPFYTQVENTRVGKRNLTKVRFNSRRIESIDYGHPGDSTTPPVILNDPPATAIPKNRNNGSDRNSNPQPQTTQPSRTRNDNRNPENSNSKPSTPQNETGPGRNRVKNNIPFTLPPVIKTNEPGKNKTPTADSVKQHSRNGRDRKEAEETKPESNKESSRGYKER
jgi:hypothetical protein